jgi:FkbM family methyltransferase
MAFRELPTVPPRQLVRKYLRKKAWRWFDWQQNFFLKPNDAISKLPLAGEVHDEDVVEALRHLAAALPDRFLDLGANIGLVAMQLADHVRRIDCVEPNPLVAGVLRINLALNCRNDFHVHEFGLGPADADALLFIPRGNIGGAFIRDANEYSAEQLARKDGYARFDAANYLTQPVRIRECGAALRELRGEATGNNAESLLVKIDVEGLESLILAQLLTTCRDLFERSAIALVFESHDHQSAQRLQQQVAAFGYGLYGLRIVRLPAQRQPLLRRVRKLMGGEQRRLEFVALAELRGDLSVTNFACCPAALIDAINRPSASPR